jgi:mono/diheme cytochrome c family protein
MADTAESQQLEKRVDTPEPDPIADRSMSSLLLIFSLLLIGTLVWSLYDEVFGQRPWKSYQSDFVERYTAKLTRMRGPQGRREREIKESDEYQKLDSAYQEALGTAKDRLAEIGSETAIIDQKASDINEPFQNAKAWIAAKTYELETLSMDERQPIRQQIEEKKKEKIEVTFHEGDRTRDEEFTFTALEELYNKLNADKARLVAEQIRLSKPVSDTLKKRDEYLQDSLGGLTAQQVGSLIDKMNSFDYSIKQIHVTNGDLVDRCESCHLGVREPVTITPREMGNQKAFVSHPDKELLKIHEPERFGCSTCHGGNGRGTTTVQKGHGRYKHWLWPLYYNENVQAGCNQCHNRDRVTPMADVLNNGKNLFQIKGCTGCHRYEGFDRESEGIASTFQTIKQLEMERKEYMLAVNEIREGVGEDRARRLVANSDAMSINQVAASVMQTVSNIDARIDEMRIQSKHLLQDQKKVGPNLKEIKAKVRKEWVPAWLKDPQAFRPGTKMPTFRLEDDEIEAISAFLWQDALNETAPTQPPGDANRGKELFKTTGCLACHSIDGKAIDLSDQTVGGDFAANLSRVGEKANYDYIVRWVHNPRQRLAPYSPTAKRDLTRADYSQKGLPWLFDDEHALSPLDGSALQIQNMTVMPNFRLSDQDARDIATFLMGRKLREPRYADASFMDNQSLRAQGEQLVKSYGCAGCHEIKGLEEEQRIGTELTPEGSKPIERLDFALLTEVAKKGEDPFTGEEGIRKWYDHKGFFEYKLRSPGVYDFGKEKPPQERLKMPNIYLEEADITALTTFLLGSVTTSLPESLRYNPVGQKKQVQDGWWVVQKYNCMGCHNVLVGQDSVLMGLEPYQSADGKEQLPPRLTNEGARVDPVWLMRFLKDPSLAASGEGQQQAARVAQHLTGAPAVAPNGGAVASLGRQPGLNRNGVRSYLKVRMPTFNFSPNELQALVNFFMGDSAQQMPYTPEKLEPLTPEEQGMARAIFTSPAAPCLKCHMTGDAAHDARATAPNFLLAKERLKPEWTRRWVVDPQLISPGTSMPSGLFNRDPVHDRWIVNGVNIPAFQTYEKDHVSLLVRYMFQITQDEQRRLGTGGAPAPAPPPATKTASVIDRGGPSRGRHAPNIAAILKPGRDSGL